MYQVTHQKVPRGWGESTYTYSTRHIHAKNTYVKDKHKILFYIIRTKGGNLWNNLSDVHSFNFPCGISNLLRIIRSHHGALLRFSVYFSLILSVLETLQSLALPHRSFFILSFGHPSQYYHISNDCHHPVLQWQKSPSSAFTPKHYMWL